MDDTWSEATGSMIIRELAVRSRASRPARNLSETAARANWRRPRLTSFGNVASGWHWLRPVSGHRIKALRKIVDEVLRVFQSYMQSHDRSNGPPVFAGSRVSDVDDRREAFEAAP